MDSERLVQQDRTARPILPCRGRCGSGPACYVAALKVYVLVAWDIPTTLEKWFEPSGMRYDFYQAEHPWGPWTRIQPRAITSSSAGTCMAPLCPRFQEQAAGT